MCYFPYAIGVSGKLPNVKNSMCVRSIFGLFASIVAVENFECQPYSLSHGTENVITLMFRPSSMTLFPCLLLCVVVYMKMFKDQFFVVLQKYTRTSQIVYNRKCKGLIAILPCLFWPKLSVVFSAAIFLQFMMHEVKL